jgi:hypothetical protein
MAYDVREMTDIASEMRDDAEAAMTILTQDGGRLTGWAEANLQSGERFYRTAQTLPSSMKLATLQHAIISYGRVLNVARAEGYI